MRRAALTVLAAALAACSPRPDPASPALWQADCPTATGPTQRGWLFGTVHALERPAAWQGERISAALAKADVLMVELADLNDAGNAAAIWTRLSRSPGHGPLSARVSPRWRKPLAGILAEQRLSDADFEQTETWAAALTIAQRATRHLDSSHGIDRAVIKAADGKQIIELEGREAQLAIFDRLPESEQRDLLEAVIADVARGRDESADLAAAWRNGDMTTITAETERGMLADPELREALFTGRNRQWTGRILAAMAHGRSPFVAVGAAHLVGDDGLAAMLAAAGCEIVRVQ